MMVNVYGLLCCRIVVHNWTVEQVVSWLQYDVDLPQYLDTFRMNAVDGSTLPRYLLMNT